MASGASTSSMPRRGCTRTLAPWSGCRSISTLSSPISPCGLGCERTLLCSTSTPLFSFLYLKKSKFQKYMFVLKNFKNTPGCPMGGGDRPPCRACGRGPLVARGGRRQAPCRLLGGATDPLPFFSQGPRCEFEKKLHLGPVDLWGRPGYF